MNADLQVKLDNTISLITETVAIVSTIKAQDWSLDASRDFCNRRDIIFSDNQYHQYQTQISNLKNFDYNELLDKLNQAQLFFDSVRSDNSNWDNYNEQYITYIEAQITGTEQQLQAFHNNITPHGTSHFNNFLASTSNALLNANNISTNVNELFEHFKFGNKNYVVFGKNGAGKTTLLRKISTDVLGGSSVVIPANRIVEISPSSYIRINSAYNHNEKLSDASAIRYLLLDMQNLENQNYRCGIPQAESVYQRLCDIFNNLELERSISSENTLAFLTVQTDGTGLYSLADGSDGERTAAYMIMSVLLAPKNSYIFIDEPENHLNTLLMRNLFDSLEQARTDVRFIYLTHKIDFIESRNNIELIYLEKTKELNKWNFKKLPDYEDIDLDIILGIEGAQNDIIFCEGNSTSSIDSRILSCVYPEYTIKAVGSCDNVKQNTKAINSAQGIFRRKAVGVVDEDYYLDEEKDTLQRSGVLVLDYNEWENLLLDADVLAAVNSAVGIHDIESVELDIIASIEPQKRHMLNDFLNKRYFRIISSGKLDFTSDLDSKIETINAENKQRILDEVNTLSTKFDEFIERKEYSKLLGIIPGKMIISNAAKAIGLAGNKAYIDKVLMMLQLDNEFRKLFKVKIGLDAFRADL